MKTSWHFVISLIIALYFYTDSTRMILLFTLGGTIIDIDHLIYVIYSQRTLSPSKIKKWISAEYKIHRPHYYIFHSFEFVILLLILLIFFNNAYFAVFVWGIIFHLILDIISYLFIYRSFKPWSRYFFLTSAIFKI